MKIYKNIIKKIYIYIEKIYIRNIYKKYKKYI